MSNELHGEQTCGEQGRTIEEFLKTTLCSVKNPANDRLLYWYGAKEEWWVQHRDFGDIFYSGSDLSRALEVLKGQEK